MKFREHRGGLAESMATVVELNTKEEFVAHMRKQAERFGVKGEFTLRFEDGSYDERIGWNTVTVVLEGTGVLGMLDGPPPWFRARPEFVQA